MFDPNDHLIQLKSKDGPKDYLPVAWRLVWFREQCPNGTIETEELLVDLDREVSEEVYVWNSERRRSEKVIKTGKGYARYRAVVTDGKGGKATGTKSENAASFPDFAEKAETGAIGRALAALGYGTQFAPDLDEAHRIVDSPVDRQPVLANGNGYNNHNGSAARNTTQTNASNQTQKTDQNGTQQNTEGGEVPAAATEQQLASIRKLCEHLGKPVPEEKFSFAEAKWEIQQLTAQYREFKQQQNNQPVEQNQPQQSARRNTQPLTPSDTAPQVAPETPAGDLAITVSQLRKKVQDIKPTGRTGQILSFEQFYAIVTRKTYRSDDAISPQECESMNNRLKAEKAS